MDLDPPSRSWTPTTVYHGKAETMKENTIVAGKSTEAVDGAGKKEYPGFSLLPIF